MLPVDKADNPLCIFLNEYLQRLHLVNYFKVESSRLAYTIMKLRLTMYQLENNCDGEDVLKYEFKRFKGISSHSIFQLISSCLS